MKLNEADFIFGVRKRSGVHLSIPVRLKSYSLESYRRQISASDFVGYVEGSFGLQHAKVHKEIVLRAW